MKSLIQGFLTGTRGQARALAPRLVISPRFSRHLNTPREISPLWGQIPHLSVQVPPRTPKQGKFPAKQTSLEHATRFARPPWPLHCGEAAMTTPLIAPLIRPPARPGAREHGRISPALRLSMAAAPQVPALPGDIVYGTGRMDESGRVGD